MAVNVGTIEGTITLKDQYTAKAREITAETLRIKAASDDLASSIGVPFKVAERAIKQTEDERARLLTDYKRLAGALDPVERKTYEYDRAVDTLTRSLKAGIISQETYNLRLAQTRARLDDNIHWTRRLGTEISSSLKGSLGSYLAVGAAVTAIGGALVSVAKQTVKANIEAEASAHKVEAAVERYGSRAGITVQEIDKLAGAQSRLTGIDDELIAESIALGLRFNRLSGDEIPRLIAVAQDMAEVTGMDLPAAMQKAGGYVNLPLQALTKLRREGYAVGESQEKMVKDLLRAGDVAGAQAQVFKILEAQYGGAAEAARDTLGGALTALGTSWENMLEKVGEDRLGPLRDGVEKLIDLVEELTGNIDEMVNWWYRADLAVNKVLLTIGKLQLGAAEGPLARFLNPRGAEISADKQRKAIADLVADVKKSEQALGRSALRIIAPGIAESMSALTRGHKAGAAAADELTDSESKLADSIDKVKEAVESALQASRDELSDAQALLKARKLSIDAMKLQQNVQAAFAKAQAAGKGATSAQRLEIVRNTLATLAAKEGIDNLAEAQKRAADLFAVSNKEMMRQFEILVQLEAATRDLLSASIEINAAQVDTGGAQATATTRARLDYAAEWREAWKAASEAAQEEIGRVMGSLLTVEEKERAIAEIRSQLLDAYLSEWGSFFSTLGNMFGGVFQQVSNAINSIQQAQQAGKQLGGLLGGQGSQLASTLGYFGATVAVIYEIYKAVDLQIKKNRARKWGDVTQLGITDGSWSQETFSGDRGGQEVSQALRRYVRDLIASIGGVIDELPQITIRARKDGKEFSAYVAGIWVGTFKDAQTAIEEGTRYAITHADFAALSAEFVHALSESIDVSMDELQANLGTARSVRRARIGDTGTDYVEISDRRLQEIDAARRLGLSIDDLIRARRDEVDALKYSALGIDTSISTLIANLRSLDAGIAEAAKTARASLEQEIRAMQEELENRQRTLDRRIGPEGDINVGGGGSQGPAGVIYDFSVAVDEETQRLRDSLAAAEAELAKIPDALSDLEVEIGVFGALDKYIRDSRKYEEDRVRLAKAKVEIEFALIRAQLAMWGKLEQFAGLLDDAYARAMEMAEDEVRNGGRGRGRGAGGGAGGDRDSARQFLRDRRFDLALSQMDEYARRVAEVSREYDIQIAQAGKDKKLRAELIALKDRELAQLADEQRRTTARNFQEFLGLVTPFDQVRETAADLIKEIESSPFGDARKARMIGRVMAELDTQLNRLARQEALDLFGGMIGDLERYGASEEMLLDARKAAALIEHTLNLENYRVRIAALEAEGRLAPEVLAKLKAAFNYLEGVDVTKFILGKESDVPPPPPSGGGYYEQTGLGDPSFVAPYGDTGEDPRQEILDRVNREFEEGRELLEKYKQDGLDPWHRALVDLNKDFQQIFKAVAHDGKLMAEATDEYKEALARLRAEYLEPLDDLYKDLSRGEMSGVSIDEQYKRALMEWEKLSNAVRGGDLSLTDEYSEQADILLKLLGRIGGGTSGAYGELRDRIRREIEDIRGAGSGNGSWSGMGAGFESLQSSWEKSSKRLEDSSSKMADKMAEAVNFQGTRQVSRLADVVGRLDSIIDWIRANGAPTPAPLSFGN